MLIAFGGLPGTGKTTVAKALARKLPAVYLRIDTFEQAIMASGDNRPEIGPSGYLAAYAVAEDNLRLGLPVVADSANLLNITRAAWRNVALKASVRIYEIELVCSDPTTHRLRIEGRRADIAGHSLPTWNSVLGRPYDAWDSEHLVIDTASLSVEQAIEAIIHRLSTTDSSTEI
ncbi:putative kinase [Paraburkholderia terricola]|jgi:predicted kinase|uniref:AAA family ATPase n=1 Tax=Paraburkholderia terricola TaxID=169427 RepID=UPI0028615E1B|nr:AAA family ATPase [Paraburkholderia terricola]MDR6495707.1 putative kinase [Paraburkholderia terricola]